MPNRRQWKRDRDIRGRNETRVDTTGGRLRSPPRGLRKRSSTRATRRRGKERERDWVVETPRSRRTKTPSPCTYRRRTTLTVNFRKFGTPATASSYDGRLRLAKLSLSLSLWHTPPTDRDRLSKIYIYSLIAASRGESSERRAQAPLFSRASSRARDTKRRVRRRASDRGGAAPRSIEPQVRQPRPQHVLHHLGLWQRAAFAEVRAHLFPNDSVQGSCAQCLNQVSRKREGSCFPARRS